MRLTMNKKQVVVSQYIAIMHSVLEKTKKSKQEKKRKMWVRQIFARREELGFGEHLMNEMLLEDQESFYNFSRMTKSQFAQLLNFIRKPINEKDRLLITLRFLATGMSYSSLSYDFRIGKSTVHNIVVETTKGIWSCLHKTFIPKPTKAQMKSIAHSFWLKTGMPNVFGAIDGKHCVIQAPYYSGTLYRNYKKTFSIVLLAVCDADYKYTYVNVGAYGSEADGGVLRRSEFGQALLNNELDLPADENMPNSTLKFPFYLVSDEAFPLKPHLMRPYGGRDLTEEKEVFNKRLSSSRRYIENSFAILVAKFRIYHTLILASPELANSIVKSTVVLHNFIRSTKPNRDTVLEEIQLRDVPNLGGWRRLNKTLNRFNNSTSEALHLRD